MSSTKTKKLRISLEAHSIHMKPNLKEYDSLLFCSLKEEIQIKMIYFIFG